MTSDRELAQIAECCNCDKRRKQLAEKDKTIAELKGSLEYAQDKVDEFWAKLKEFNSDNEKLQTELSDLRNGIKGACPTCEPVGEMNKKLRECLELFLDDYAKRKLTYGWQDLMARKFRQCLKEIEGE